MTNLDVRELREKTEKELLDMLEDQREAVFNLRFQRGFGQLDDQNAIKRTQRDIARIMMVLREREIQTLGDAYQQPRRGKPAPTHLVRKPKKGKELKKGDTLGKQ
ncbi:MAG: 50S ribosomal protein L29 [bacterium]|nr:50S ribosomal protein L29 [bacterium]